MNFDHEKYKKLGGLQAAQTRICFVFLVAKKTDLISS